MKRVRLLVIGIGAVFSLGMLLWSVDFVLRVGEALALISPLLAQGFFAGVLLLLLAIGGVGIYYTRQFL
ncbi:MAG: GTPase, partial [Cyanobacteria bacterium J06638_28]